MLRLLLLSALLCFGGVVSCYCARSTTSAKQDKSQTDSRQSVVVKKNNSLQSIKELLKKNNFNGDLDELLVNIQNTQNLLAGLVGRHRMTKAQLKNEIDKFNSNMQNIVQQYNKLVKNQEGSNKKEKNINDNDHANASNMPKSSKQIAGHSIVTLDCRKQLRFDRSNSPIQELMSPLTEENIQEIIELGNQKNVSSLLDCKDLPDSDTQCTYISTSESAKNSILDIEEQKHFNK